MRSTTSWHVLAFSRSSSADSTTKPLPPVSLVLTSVPVPVVSSRRRVRVGSIGRALKAAKLVLPTDALVPGVEGERGDGAAVLKSRRDRRVAADGVRESGGGLRFVDSVVGGRVGVSVDGGDRIAVDFGKFLLGEAPANVEEVVDGCLSDTLERGESGPDLVGEAETETETLGPLMNLLLLPLGEVRGPLGEDGMSALLRRE
jgi:hypothetical protein